MRRAHGAAAGCEGSKLPSTCYSGEFIPYTIRHGGPYPVNNHWGERYEAPLFTGWIEHGKGLAAERYITNPISSADRSLIEPYMHTEFQGRPLTGDYRLRVWDNGELDFDAIDDVQIVMKYRYWTRFE